MDFGSQRDLPSLACREASGTCSSSSLQSSPAPLPTWSPQALSTFTGGEIFHPVLGGSGVQVVMKGQLARPTRQPRQLGFSTSQASLESVRQISPPYVPLRAWLHGSFTL